QARKPLVERQRRARIGASLRALRALLAGGEVSGAGAARLAQAAVLDLAAQRVRAALERRVVPARALPEPRAASERFAAGYIRCLHEVHSFVCACPAIDAAAAAALLSHLLRALPLGASPPEPPEERTHSPALPAPAPEPAPSEDTCSEVEVEAEPGLTPTEGLDTSRTHSSPSPCAPKSMWRPW
ncbi:HES6 protein, partial [Crotophaga sulcirostris]|nr:HES6 protein [Crotophaga sulcirostris]